MNAGNTEHPRPLHSEIHNRRSLTNVLSYENACQKNKLIDAIEKARGAKCRMLLSRKKVIVITHSGVYDKMTRLSVPTNFLAWRDVYR